MINPIKHYLVFKLYLKETQKRKKEKKNVLS